MAWAEYRGIVWEASDKFSEAKAQQQLSVVREIKDNRNDFNRHVARKRKTGDKVGTLQKDMEDLDTLDKEKAKVFNDFCSSVFNGKYIIYIIDIVGEGQVQ